LILSLVERCGSNFIRRKEGLLKKLAFETLSKNLEGAREFTDEKAFAPKTHIYGRAKFFCIL
jgi:hypothetical protein